MAAKFSVATGTETRNYVTLLAYASAIENVLLPPNRAGSMQLNLGSTRVPACSDRRPRRSDTGAHGALKSGEFGRSVWPARAPTTAREGACAPRLQLNCSG